MPLLAATCVAAVVAVVVVVEFDVNIVGAVFVVDIIAGFPAALSPMLRSVTRSTATPSRTKQNP